MLQPTVAKINLSNLRHNVQVLRRLCNSEQFFCPMVKADAYGHGAIEVSKVLIHEGVSHLGVSRFEEAIALRDAGFNDVHILLFDPFVDIASAPVIHARKITPVLSNWESLSTLASVVGGGSTQSIHVKFNTGMGRLGFALSDAKKISEFLKSNTKLKLEGICSHLLSAEDYGTAGSRTEEQLKKLKIIQSYFSGLNLHVHILNSGGVIALAAHHEKNTTWGARPGLSLYGVKPELLNTNPEVQEKWAAIELKPVMQVETVVSHIQKIAMGETVSYGGRFLAKRDSTIVVLPIGYADGYTRHFSGRGKMLVRGQEARVVGTVCMDFTMLDITDLDISEKLKLDEPVVVLGEQAGRNISASALANIINTNSYEILTNFSSRIPRVYI